MCRLVFNPGGSRLQMPRMLPPPPILHSVQSALLTGSCMATSQPHLHNKQLVGHCHCVWWTLGSWEMWKLTDINEVLTMRGIFYFIHVLYTVSVKFSPPMMLHMERFDVENCFAFKFWLNWSNYYFMYEHRPRLQKHDGHFYYWANSPHLHLL